MTNWLGKSWWQGMGVLVALVLSIATILRQRTNKELGYEVVSQTVLVSLDDSAAQDLEVRYKGQPVTGAMLSQGAG